MGKGGVSVRTRSHNPKDDDEREESEEVENDGETFENRKLSDGRSVEKDSGKYEGHRQERTVPTLAR